MSRCICYVVVLWFVGLCELPARGNGPPTDNQIQRAMDFLRRNQNDPWHNQVAPAGKSTTQFVIESLQVKGAAPVNGSTRMIVKGGTVEITGGVIRIIGADVIIEIPTEKR